MNLKKHRIMYLIMCPRDSLPGGGDGNEGPKIRIEASIFACHTPCKTLGTGRVSMMENPTGLGSDAFLQRTRNSGKQVLETKNSDADSDLMLEPINFPHSKTLTEFSSSSMHS